MDSSNFHQGIISREEPRCIHKNFKSWPKHTINDVNDITKKR